MISTTHPASTLQKFPEIPSVMLRHILFAGGAFLMLISCTVLPVAADNTTVTTTIQTTVPTTVSTTTPATTATTVTATTVATTQTTVAAVTTEALPVAAFSVTSSSGTAPLTVQFTDTSTNSPTSWSWDFGDGNTSSLQNPSFTYTSAGTYTVSLTTTNSAGSNTCTKTSLITVTSSVTQPVAAFSCDLTSGTAPLTVTFSDESTNSPTSWNWNFGDGETSTLENPAHTYAAAGTYTVTLTATNAAGSSSNSCTRTITANIPEETTNPTQIISTVPTYALTAKTTTAINEQEWLEKENAKISPAATATKSPGFGLMAALAGGWGGFLLFVARRKH